MRINSIGSYLCGDQRGIAALEFGLAIPVLLVLITGLTEVGMAGFEAMQVKDAAEAGALYASQHPADLTGIQNAVVTATGTTGITATPAPTSFCGCPGATGITVGNCTTVCPNGDAQGNYVRVNASLTHSKILAFAGFADPQVLTGVSTLRVP
ncbi:MAG TPA: TadE/TadG family type IV pilus assembly protein [Micropepsaceae bacterium]|nr:TadE/TadG family type IV pilus assembly protein [Micropepsaceae bacterium]